MHAILDGVLRTLRLPEPDEPILPGIFWGAFDQLLTPAYWRGQLWQHEVLGTYCDPRLGNTLTEEVAACLLGGHGMPAELGLSAFARVRSNDLLLAGTTAAELEKALSAPFSVGGRERCYRFPRQKARQLAACLDALEKLYEPERDRALRDALTKLPGIGLKTASWVVRNYRGSNEVAIVDVHILRAGQHINLFPPDWEPQKHYGYLEEAFLRFAGALDVSAAMLDGLMWDYMRRLSRVRSHTSQQQIELFENAAVQKASL